MFLYLNESKDKYQELIQKHKNAIFELKQPGSTINDSMQMIWRSLVFSIKSQPYKFTHKTQINRDLFTGSLRRVKLGYTGLKSADLGPAGQDDRENFSLVFFHNAKVFLEIAKKNFEKIFSKGEFKDLYKTVTVIRDYFAHSYEKDSFEKSQKVVVRVDINHRDNEGLYELEVFDFDDSRKIFSIYYSVDLIYSQIKKVAIDINDKV